MSKRLLAYGEMTLAMSIVGSSVVVGKFIIASFPIFLASTMRFAVGLPILLLLVTKNWSELKNLRRWDWLILFAQALTGTFLFNICLLHALNLTSATEAGIITSTAPAVIALGSWFFLRERLSRYELIGVGLAVAGIVAINVLGANLSDDQGRTPLLGNLLVMGAVIGEALFTILRKINGKRVSPLTSATVVTFFALILFLPLGLYEATTFDFWSVPADQYLSILYAGVVVTALAYFLWFSGVPAVTASTAAVFTGVLPVSAVALSCLLLGESLTWAHLVGVMCVLGGIGFIARET